MKATQQPIKLIILLILLNTWHFLLSQKNKPKFYDRLQFVAEFQVGRQKKLLKNTIFTYLVVHIIKEFTLNLFMLMGFLSILKTAIFQQV